MTQQIHLTWADMRTLARETAERLRRNYTGQTSLYAYAIPRGGLPAALLVQGALVGSGLVLDLCETPEDADIFIDDIIDSGATRAKYSHGHKRPFVALVDKLGMDAKWTGKWVVFPWERMTQDSGPEQNIVRILEYLGEDANRDGLKETPARVVRSYQELYSGYKQDPKDVIKCFEDPYDELVLLKDIQFSSVCEHHMLPFMGMAHIGYIPDGRIVGISKLARVLEIYSRRLQVQERLTVQVTDALDAYLKPKGSACIVEASHSCISCRGINKQQSKMVTSSLTGVFRHDARARTELLQLIKG